MEYSNINAEENITITPNIPTLPDDSPCGTNVNIEFVAVCMLVSVGIIICLSFLEKRSNARCRCASQRPGIIYPVNLLDHNHDNFGYSMAFGSVASVCFNLFTEAYRQNTLGPIWTNTLYLMLVVLETGLMVYPFFACLTTTWVFVGSLFGLGYTSLWLYWNVRTVILCPNGAGEDSLPGAHIAIQIPVLFCLVCLLLRYAYILIRHIELVVKERSINTVIEQCKREHMGTEYNVTHVRELLVPACRAPVTGTEQVDKPPRHKRLMEYIKRHLYMNDPTFKYSTRIICIFTVTLICAYQFGILVILAAYQLLKIAPAYYPDINSDTTDPDRVALLKQLRLGLHVVFGCMLVSFCLSSLMTFFSIFQILTNYRHNIKLMCKGTFSHLPFKRDNRHPLFIMSDSLSYAGSQIAYTLWGYVLVMCVLFITSMAVAYLVILPVFNLIPREFLSIFLNILAGFLVLQAVYILQKVLCRAFLQTRHSVDEKGNVTNAAVLALNNRKLYHNVSYFLFFFYIVLGLFGCLLTIIKGTMLGIVYLARMDKCGLIAGYETWDKGYMYYVSFLHVEECHRHPVLLVFCDVLLDSIQAKPKNYGMRNYSSTEPIVDSSSGHHQDDVAYGYNRTHYSPRLNLDRAGLLARNRWFKAYTMIRNPNLRQTDVGDEFDKLVDLDTHAINLSENVIAINSDKTVKLSLEV